jgi:hypothetical protein
MPALFAVHHCGTPRHLLCTKAFEPTELRREGPNQLGAPTQKLLQQSTFGDEG